MNYSWEDKTIKLFLYSVVCEKDGIKNVMMKKLRLSWKWLKQMKPRMPNLVFNWNYFGWQSYNTYGFVVLHDYLLAVCLLNQLLHSLWRCTQNAAK